MKVIRMKSDSNQPACLYGTAKTHMLENLEDITIANLKFRHIIDQTGTFTYNVQTFTYKVISDYYYHYLILLLLLLLLSGSIYLKLTW